VTYCAEVIAFVQEGDFVQGPVSVKLGNTNSKNPHYLSPIKQAASTTSKTFTNESGSILLDPSLTNIRFAKKWFRSFLSHLIAHPNTGSRLVCDIPSRGR
jgi:hypothetical protein